MVIEIFKGFKFCICCCCLLGLGEVWVCLIIFVDYVMKMYDLVNCVVGD